MTLEQPIRGAHQYTLLDEHSIQCPKCGEYSPNQFVHRLNHTVGVGTDLCSRQHFALRHISIEHTGDGHPTLAQRVTQARNLNIPEHLVQDAIENRRPPRPLTTLGESQ